MTKRGRPGVKVNWFKGGKSLVFETPKEGTGTNGVFMPGEWTFKTKKKEVLKVNNGSLQFMGLGKKRWKTVKEGQSVTITAGKKFKVKAVIKTPYTCLYY